MAEILVFVTDETRPDDRYQDGDIIAAFNNRRISLTHLQRICDPTQTATWDGLRPTGTVQQYMLEQVAQYRFERISVSEVRRTVLASGAQDVLSVRANEAGEAIDVRRYVALRLANVRHRMFGEPGREIWYGGIPDYSAAKLDAVWARLEDERVANRADHALWPLTETERKHFLAVPTIDMRDEIVARATATEIDWDPEQPEYDPDVGSTITRKRRALVNWRAMGLPASTVLDKSRAVDIRAQMDPVQTENLQVKRRKTVWSARGHLRDVSDREYFV